MSDDFYYTAIAALSIFLLSAVAFVCMVGMNLAKILIVQFIKVFEIIFF